MSEKVRMSLSGKELSGYLIRQLNHFFLDNHVIRATQMQPYINEALKRLEYCFSRIRCKYFFDGQTAIFDHLNSDQYAMFLYLLSNTIYKVGEDQRLATKIYYLNKSLHAIDVYYEVDLPDVFLFRHCVGTVLGRAKYANYFTIGQGCTVGHDKGIFPEFKEKVAMYNGSMVAGKCVIGPDCHISTKTFIRNQDVAGGTVVFGRSPSLVTKPATRRVYDVFFNCWTGEEQ